MPIPNTKAYRTSCSTKAGSKSRTCNCYLSFKIKKTRCRNVTSSYWSQSEKIPSNASTLTSKMKVLWCIIVRIGQWIRLLLSPLSQLLLAKLSPVLYMKLARCTKLRIVTAGVLILECKVLQDLIKYLSNLKEQMTILLPSIFQQLMINSLRNLNMFSTNTLPRILLLYNRLTDILPNLRLKRIF